MDRDSARVVARRFDEERRFDIAGSVKDARARRVIASLRDDIAK